MNRFRVLSLVLGFAACVGLLGASPSWPLRLGLQAWTFKDLTFEETVREAARLGVTRVQAFPGQRLGEGFDAGGRFHHSLSEEVRGKVLALAKRHGVAVTGYGVVNGRDAEEWGRIFAFAKAMGMEDIAIEPKEETWPETLPLVIRLSRETGVKFGLHNHPNPVKPAEFLAKVDAHDAKAGLCADTGHWARSGWDPVESLKAAEGRIVSVHFKDLTQRSAKGAHDMPWGTGSSDAAGQLAELRRQKFAGIVYLEYEHWTPNLKREVAACVEYFSRAGHADDATLIAGGVPPPGYVPADRAGDIAPKADAGMWSMPGPLFAPDLAGAVFAPGSWSWKEGALSGRGRLTTRESWGNPIVGLEFLCEEGAEAGVLLRVNGEREEGALEVRIRQADTGDEKQLTGAIAGCQAPGRPLVLEPGRWYGLVIMAKDARIVALLDGEKLTEIDLDKWSEAGRNPDGSANAHPVALKELPREGAVGLVARAGVVKFRNLTIEKY